MRPTVGYDVMMYSLCPLNTSYFICNTINVQMTKVHDECHGRPHEFLTVGLMFVTSKFAIHLRQC